MVVLFCEEKHAAFAHELDDFRIGFEDAQPGEVFDFIRKATGVIDWTIDIKAVLLADHEVIVAVTGGSMNQSGAGFARRRFGARVTYIQFNFSISFAAECDVFAQHE